MKIAIHNAAAAVGASVALAIAPGAFADDHPASSLGTPVYSTNADRVLRIGPETKSVNVRHYETVRFLVGSKSFTWRFDTLNVGAFELNKVAPQGIFDNQKIMVYVGRHMGEGGD